MRYLNTIIKLYLSIFQLVKYNYQIISTFLNEIYKAYIPILGHTNPVI